MCLNKLAKFKPCGVGYKIMRHEGPILYGEYYTTEHPREVGLWLDEKNFRDDFIKSDTINIDRGNKMELYPSGWHIFHSKRQALIWKAATSKVLKDLVCVKVEVKEPLAVGYQNNRRITVAKQIKILSIVS